MWRLIFLLSAIPFLAGGAAAQLLGFRKLRHNPQTHLDVDTLLKRLLDLSGLKDVEIHYSRKFWSFSSNYQVKKIMFDERLRSNKDANSLACAAIQFGLFSLQKEHASTVQWRRKMVKSGYLLPVFVILITLFTSLVGKLPVRIALAVATASLGFVTAMLWMSMPVEREAGKIAIRLIEKYRIFPRIKEEEAVINAIHATTWSSLMPAVLRKFMIGSQIEKSPNS